MHRHRTRWCYLGLCVLHALLTALCFPTTIVFPTARETRVPSETTCPPVARTSSGTETLPRPALLRREIRAAGRCLAGQRCAGRKRPRAQGPLTREGRRKGPHEIYKRIYPRSNLSRSETQELSLRHVCGNRGWCCGRKTKVAALMYSFHDSEFL